MPDEQMLGLEGAERVAWRRETEQQVHPCGAPPVAKNLFVPIASATTSVCCAGHQSAVSRHRFLRWRGIASNGLPGNVSGATTCGTPSSWATASQSRLWRSMSWSTAIAFPSSRARASAGSKRTGSTSHTRPSAARACDVRVIGSSTIHENPAHPRSSQSLIVMRRAYASARSLVLHGAAHPTCASALSSRGRRDGGRRSRIGPNRVRGRSGAGASLQPPPGAPRCPWCHAIEDLVTGVCRLCADSVPAEEEADAARAVVSCVVGAPRGCPAHTGRRAANGGVAALRSSPPARSGRLRMPAVGDAARMGA